MNTTTELTGNRAIASDEAGQASDAQITQAMAPAIETLKSTLSGVQEQIRFADSKAGFIALFHTVLFGFLATQADSIALTDAASRGIRFWVSAAVLMVYGVTAVVAVIKSRAARQKRRFMAAGKWREDARRTRFSASQRENAPVPSPQHAADNRRFVGSFGTFPTSGRSAARETPHHRVVPAQAAPRA